MDIHQSPIINEDAVEVSLSRSLVERLFPEGVTSNDYKLRFELDSSATQMVKENDTGISETVTVTFLEDLKRADFSDKKVRDWSHSVFNQAANVLSKQELSTFISDVSAALLNLPVIEAVAIVDIYKELRNCSWQHQVELPTKLSKAILDKCNTYLNSPAVLAAVGAEIRSFTNSVNEVLNCYDGSHEIKWLVDLYNGFSSEGNLTGQELFEAVLAHMTETASPHIASDFLHDMGRLAKDIKPDSLAELATECLTLRANCNEIELKKAVCSGSQVTVDIVEKLLEAQVPINWKELGDRVVWKLIDACIAEQKIATAKFLSEQSGISLGVRVYELLGSSIEDEFDLVLFDSLLNEFDIEPEVILTEAYMKHLDQRLDALVLKDQAEEAGELWIKIACLKHYLKERDLVASIATTMNLEPGRARKIMVFQVGEKHLIRGVYNHLVEDTGYHRDIVRGFKAELKQRGLKNLKSKAVGGAKISIPVDDSQPVVISGRSVDFGECNKELVVEIVRSAFPSRVVIAEAAL